MHSCKGDYTKKAPFTPRACFCSSPQENYCRGTHVRGLGNNLEGVPAEGGAKNVEISGEFA
jgi:hypothetical protein